VRRRQSRTCRAATRIGSRFTSVYSRRLRTRDADVLDQRGLTTESREPPAARWRDVLDSRHRRHRAPAAAAPAQAWRSRGLSWSDLEPVGVAVSGGAGGKVVTARAQSGAATTSPAVSPTIAAGRRDRRPDRRPSAGGSWCSGAAHGYFSTTSVENPAVICGTRVGKLPINVN
jgi:hypothetical protein